MTIESLTALVWKAVIFLGILLIVGIVFKLLTKKPLRGGRQKIRVKDTLKNSGLAVGDHPDGLIFGLKNRRKVYQNYKSEGHIVVFGESGIGKTSALLIPSLRAWLGSFFCIDISGDINKNVTCQDKIVLAPDDPDNSIIYNVFDTIDRETDPDERQEKLEQLVNLIIPMAPTVRDAQEYFLRTARKILLASMTAFYAEGYDFVEICKKVFFAGCEDLFKQIVATKNKLANGYIKSMAGENEKNIAGAKSMLDDHIKIFSDNKKMEKILRRPTDALGNAEPYLAPSDLERTHIFLVIPDKKQEYYSLFMNIVVAQMMDYISQRDYDRQKDKRILLALDEFASLRHLEILGPMRKFRKNGANICLLTQSLADIDLVYSRDERKVILDNAAYIVVLSARDNETRQYFSDQVGKEDTKKLSSTSSTNSESTSTSYIQEYAIPLNTWQNLGNDLIVIHRGGYARLQKNYYFKE